MMNLANKKRILIQKISIAIATTLCFVCAALFGIESRRIKRNQDVIIGRYAEYTVYARVSDLMKKGSDTLTEHARLYVFTGETKFMDGYFTESDVTGSREKAVNMLAPPFNDRYGAKEKLENIIGESVSLMDTEYRAMKLVYLSGGAAEADAPYEKIRSFALTDEEKSLTAEQMKQRAESLLYDENYRTAKRSIISKTEALLNELLENTDDDLKTLNDRQSRDTSFQQVVLGLFMLSVIVLSLLIVLDSKDEIRRSRKLKDAETYSAALNEKLVEVEKIAKVDPLTGINNVTAYIEKLNGLKDSLPKNFAIVALDINNLKGMNDSFGHDAGNKYIQNCCEVFVGVFDKDCVYRVGGDEFAVIIEDEQLFGIKALMSKLRRAAAKAEKYSDVNSGYASFSYGLAIYDPDKHKTVEDVIKLADEKMYEYKRTVKS